MQKIKISVVAYLNSRPFIDGLENSGLINQIDLQKDVPSICAQKLLDGKVDIGLVPVAILPQLKEKYIISDYCIGAEGKVASVMLYSEVPLEKITNILLDYQSRTSITLVKILAANYWKIDPNWEQADINYESKISGNTAAVIIGDRTFGKENKYKYSYDLAEEWQKFTGLPFVFACWVSNKQMTQPFIAEFNLALRNGLLNRPALIKELQKENKYSANIETYLNQNIDYNFDENKKMGLELFLSYLSRIKG